VTDFTSALGWTFMQRRSAWRRCPPTSCWRSARLAYDHEAVERELVRWPGARVCCEAGPTGFGLYRHLTAGGGGIACDVVAPGLVPSAKSGPGTQLSSNPLCSNFSVAAFSETVRTFESSNPSGAVASISIVTFNVTPGVAPSGPSTSSASFLKSVA